MARRFVFPLVLIALAAVLATAFAAPQAPRAPAGARTRIEIKLDDRGKALIDAYRNQLRRAMEERAKRSR